MTIVRISNTMYNEHFDVTSNDLPHLHTYTNTTLMMVCLNYIVEKTGRQDFDLIEIIAR